MLITLMRQKVLSKALCSLQRSKQGWQPSFEEYTPPAACLGMKLTQDQEELFISSAI